MGTQEATGLAKLTQWAAGGQGGSEDPAFPLIPHSDLSGQAEWPATYLGHGLRPGMGEWVQGQDSALERNQGRFRPEHKCCEVARIPGPSLGAGGGGVRQQT